MPRDGLDPIVEVDRRLRLVTDRYTWKRVLLFDALLVWLMKSYGGLAGEGVGQSYIGVWVLAAVGCWAVSGWLLDLPRLLFPDVLAFQHLRRLAPRR